LSETGVRGAFLDSWPFLWKIPQWFFPVCKRAREIAAKHRNLIWRNYSDVQDRTAKGAALPSFNQAIQEKLKQGWLGVSEIEGAEIGHHLLTGTTDTTASSLINWVAAMCLNPEAQKKAQQGNTSPCLSAFLALNLYTILQCTVTQSVQRSTGLLALIVCPRTMTQ
jgi:cytochrome P450